MPSSSKRPYQLVVEIPTRSALAQTPSFKRPRIFAARSPSLPPSPTLSTSSSDSLKSITSTSSESTTSTGASSVIPIPTGEGAVIGLIPFDAPSSPLQQLAVAASFVEAQDGAVEILSDGSGRLVRTDIATPLSQRCDIKPNLAQTHGRRVMADMSLDAEMDVGDRTVTPETRDQGNLADALVDFVELLDNALPRDEGEGRDVPMEIELDAPHGNGLGDYLMFASEPELAMPAVIEVVDEEHDTPPAPSNRSASQNGGRQDVVVLDVETAGGVTAAIEVVYDAHQATLTPTASEDGTRIQVDVATVQNLPVQAPEINAIDVDMVEDGPERQHQDHEAPTPAEDDDQSCGICYGDITDVLKEAEEAGKGGIGGGLALWVCEQPNCGMLFCITCALGWANRAIDQRRAPTCSQCTRPTDIDGLRRQAVAYDPTTPNPIHDPPAPLNPHRAGQLEQYAGGIYRDFRNQPNYRRVIDTAAGPAAWRDYLIARMAADMPARPRGGRGAWMGPMLRTADSPAIMAPYLDDVRQRGVLGRVPGVNGNAGANAIPIRVGLARPQLDEVNRQRQELRVELQNRNLFGNPGVAHPALVQHQADARRVFNAQQQQLRGVRHLEFTLLLQQIEELQRDVPRAIRGDYQGPDGQQGRQAPGADFAGDMFPALGQPGPAPRREARIEQPGRNVAFQFQPRGVRVNIQAANEVNVRLANANNGAAGVPRSRRGVQVAQPINLGLNGPERPNLRFGERPHRGLPRERPLPARPGRG